MNDPIQFTDDEIVEILTATALRSGVMRDKGPGHDRIDLLIPHLPGSAYRIERDAIGYTYLVFMSAKEWKLLASGTLDDCLRLFAR